MATETVEEVKKHKNKPDQRFTCEVVHREDDRLIVRYRATGPGRVADIDIPSGSTTVAHYRQGQGFVLWRMFAPGGGLLGTLFHICHPVRIEPARVVYEDLLLDIWVSPEGASRELDRDEVQQCLRTGQLDQDELQWIERQAAEVIKNSDRLIREAAAFDIFNDCFVFR